MTDRREFIKAAALATAASYGRILGANDRMRIGGIGTGGRCQYLLSLLNKGGGSQIVAICDVYKPHLEEAREKVAPEAREFTDYRKLLEAPDIDAVVIGAPDHWHVPMAIDAMHAGKDVYVEKPVTHSIEEGEPLIQAVGRIEARGADRHAAAKLAALPAGARNRGRRRARTGDLHSHILVSESPAGTRSARSPSTPRSWIGRCFWAPRPINRSMTSASATGVGSGILAAARSPICFCTGWTWRTGRCRATPPSMRRPWAANM